MKTETFKKGFTLAELLTAITIIAILIGILLPALNMARNFAKGAKQKTLINSLDIGVNMYKNDQGEYPPSHGKGSGATPPNSNDYVYCGAQTLAEAMVGCDLMGFHPESVFDESDNYTGYPPKITAGLYYDDGTPTSTSLLARKGLYVDRTNLGVFDACDVYGSSVNTISEGYMICDVFDGTGRTKTVGTRKVKIGTPILYFRADTSKLDIDLSISPTNNYDKIYDYDDNQKLIALGTVKNGSTHSLETNTKFYNYIKDDMASATRDRPVRPDSFLLISAGPDGLYGTTDDICNFEPNF